MTASQMRKREGVQDGVCEVRYVNAAGVKAAKAKMPDAEQLLAVADAFQTLAHPNRLRVLEALDGNELCVCDLAEVLALSMSATSQQLRELRQLGAVQFRGVGKLAYYSVANRFWLEVSRLVGEHIRGSSTTEESHRTKRVGVA